MYGVTSVPYNRIGGENISSGIMPFAMTGSTVPGLTPGGEGGNRINVTWTYPGGIVSKMYNGKGVWGYAVIRRGESETIDVNYDDTVYGWLIGEIESTETLIGVNVPHSAEEVRLELPSVAADINILVKAYVHRLINEPGSDAQMDEFKEYFEGCYYTGR